MKMKKIIIDTDVGTDVDDLFALTYAIKNPDIRIQTITTVHGNTEIRAKIVKKLERILGVEIPVIAGAEKTLDRECYWCGFEHLALSKEEMKEPLAYLKYPRCDKNTTLVCIGPLTNIALQLEKNKSIKNIKNIYLMGSSFDDHNFNVDPKATKIVLSRPWKKKYITKEVSEKINFTREDLKSLCINELGDFIYESAIRWLDYAKREKAYMYDVLTVSAAIGEDFVKFKEEGSKILSYDVDSKLKDKIIEVIRS